MLRVGVAPCEPPAVFNLRTRWPAEALAQQGLIHLVSLPNQLDTLYQVTGPKPEDRRLVQLRNPPAVDVLVITRPLASRLVEMIPFFQQHGIAVVVDIDDDFRHLPSNKPDRMQIDPKASPAYNWQHYVHACSIADLVTVSTSELVDYAPHGRVEVVRNAVPEHYLDMRGLDVARGGSRSPYLVGWTGTVFNHPGDLNVTHGGVAQAVRLANAEFMVVGEKAGVSEALGLSCSVAETGVIGHEEYPTWIASHLDVGIAPLADNAYTRAKSWIKPLEYLALGVPFVASQSPEYEALMRGFHAFSQGATAPGVLVPPRSRDWLREVSRRLRWDKQIRAEAITAGREFVGHFHTIEGTCKERLWCWEQAVQNRKDQG